MFVYGNDQRAEDLGGGVKRKVLAHDGGLMQVEVTFEEGAIGPAAFASPRAVDLCAVRRVRIHDRRRDEDRPRGRHDVQESGVMHGCRCLKPGVLLDTFTPQRADYLPK